MVQKTAVEKGPRVTCSAKTEIAVIGRRGAEKIAGAPEQYTPGMVMDLMGGVFPTKKEVEGKVRKMREAFCEVRGIANRMIGGDTAAETVQEFKSAIAEAKGAAFGMVLYDPVNDSGTPRNRIGVVFVDAVNARCEKEGRKGWTESEIEIANIMNHPINAEVIFAAFRGHDAQNAAPRAHNGGDGRNGRTIGM